MTKEGAAETFGEVKRLSDGCVVCGDLRDEAQARAMVADFVAQAGGLDVLVNNAGTMVGRADFADALLEFYEDVFATNTRSLFLVTREATAHIKKTQGCIVNVGSVAGHHGGGGGSGIYAAAKAAVATMTIAMAKEFAPWGVRVNSVIPGFIDTRFHRQYSDEERRQRMAHRTPLGRNGTPEDVAKAIVFLASDAASFITGEYLAVNGGLYMRA